MVSFILWRLELLMGSLSPRAIAELAARTFFVHPWVDGVARLVEPSVPGIQRAVADRNIGLWVADYWVRDWQWQFSTHTRRGFCSCHCLCSSPIPPKGWFSKGSTSIAYLGIFIAFAFRDMEQKRGKFKGVLTEILFPTAMIAKVKTKWCIYRAS